MNTEKHALDGSQGSAIHRRDAMVLLGAGVLMSATPSAFAQSTPRKGGILKVVAPSNPSSLDPVTGGQGGDHAFLYPIFDTLTEYEFATLKVNPGIASWDFPNPNTMLLTLKPGVLFHDGTPCDAQAVKFNIDRSRMDPRSNVKADVASISSVEVIAPLRIKLTLSQPDAALPGIFADRAGMMISPGAIQKHGNAHDRNPVGCGPWKFVSWADNQGVVLTRNDKYWRSGRPYLDGIEMTIIPEIATGIRSVVSGQNHLAFALVPRYKPLVERAKNVALIQGPSLRTEMMYFNLGRAPLNNVKVRQALNLAVDRASFIKATMGGIGEIATQNLPSAHWAYDKSLVSLYPHDPVRARKLLAEAGFPDGLELTFGGFSDQDNLRRREVITEQLGAAGIRCKFTAGTVSDIAGQFYGAEKKFDVLLASWSGRPDPSMTFSSLYGKNAYYNAGRVEVSEELTTLLQLSRAKEDQEFRKQVIARLQRLVMEHALSCPIAFSFDMTAVTSPVQGYRSNLLGKPFFSEVWLASN